MRPTAQSPVAPMLAKAVRVVPDHDSVPGGLSFEPKWDGFRAILYADDAGNGSIGAVELGSRSSKKLTRYFPELTKAFRTLLPEPCVLDGEIIVPTGGPGHQRLDWEALSQRIHPAASRIQLLAEQTPALFVAFDLLALGADSYLDRPFSERRAALEALANDLPEPIRVTRTTTDTNRARHWLVRFEGAGLDGVIAKPLDGVYTPNKRTLLKITHHRTADVVVLGYRIHTDGRGIRSLLVGLYDNDGVLHSIGGISAFSDSARIALIDELEPLVVRDESGAASMGATARSRFSSRKDASFVQLRPQRVVEVRYNQMEGMRFRHTAQFERWRPDRDARSCTFEQLERPTAYNLADVMS